MDLFSIFKNKNGPLILFLILLFVLILSIVFGNQISSWANSNTEGFLGYEYGKPVLSTVTIPQYGSGRPITKLYDDIYFDRKNSYVIILGGTQYVIPSATAPSGNVVVPNGNVVSGNVISGNNAPATVTYTVDTMSFISRTAVKTGPYVLSGNVSMSESNVVSIDATYSDSDWNIGVAPRKNVFYSTWGKDTFINIVDMSTNANPTPVISYYSPGDGTADKSRIFNLSGAATVPNEGYVGSELTLQMVPVSSMQTAQEDNTFVLKIAYDNTRYIYQLGRGVYFDTVNGNLVFIYTGKETDDTMMVYPRPTNSEYVDPAPVSYNLPITTQISPSKNASSMSDVGYYPRYILSPDKKAAILYICNKKNTFLVYMVLSSNGSGLTVQNRVRILEDGSIQTSAGVISTTPPTSGNASASSGNVIISSQYPSAYLSEASGNEISDYYKWLAFWNTVANAPTDYLNTSDFIQKSSVVPPVCPTCPMCRDCSRDSGVCTNCGGSGGSGTLPSKSDKPGEPVDTRIGSGNLLYSAGRGTKELLEQTGSGATSLVRDTAGGTVGLAREAVGGTVGLARETVGGAVGLAREAGSGIAGIFGSRPTQISEPRFGAGQGVGGQGVGQGASQGLYGGRPSGAIPGVDPYSHFGALVPKGDNFMPVTSDFSAFSK